MIWRQVRAEAARLVDEVAGKRPDLELTEYLTEERYRADHPNGRSMRDHNAIVRAAMREALRRGIYCRRRLVE